MKEKMGSQWKEWMKPHPITLLLIPIKSNPLTTEAHSLKAIIFIGRVPHIKELIENSFYSKWKLNTDRGNKNKKKVNKYHYFNVKVRIGENTYNVVLDIFLMFLVKAQSLKP